MPYNNVKKNILAVDDNVTALTEIRAILGGAFEVSLAKSVEMAWTVLKTASIDLILLDMSMPGVTGMDFLKALQKNASFQKIPVIIVSSLGVKDVIVEAMKSGARDFVVKPVNPKALREKILAVLGKIRQS